MSDEEQERAREDAHRVWRKSAVETVTYGTALVSTLGDRIIFVSGFDSLDSEDQQVQAEQLIDFLSRLLEAHSTEDQGFVSGLMSSASIADVFDREGAPIIEFLANVEPILDFVQAEAEASEYGGQVIEMLGLDRLGEVACRATMDGEYLHSDLFIAARAPRSGLLRVLDQAPIAADPPEWVPADIMSYSCLGFDLGKAYQILQEEVLRAFPDQAGQAFQMAEVQAQNFAQASIKEVLAALGHQHIVLNFEPDLDAIPNADDGLSSPSPERVALVWQLSDEGIWARLLNAVSTFVTSAPGVSFAEEQGFRGLRMDSETAEGGLVVGKNYLVFAYGQGVLESTLSLLNNPPAGEDTLIGSALYDHASSMLPWHPGMSFEVTNGNRYAHAVRQTVASTLDQLETFLSPDDDDDNSGRDWLDIARRMLPEQDEVENMFGTIAGRWEVNDEGIVARSATQLPPRD